MQLKKGQAGGVIEGRERTRDEVAKMRLVMEREMAEERTRLDAKIEAYKVRVCTYMCVRVRACACVCVCCKCVCSTGYDTCTV